ncbi:MAG: acyl carrier protein [Oscillospiraceae bacterium]|nr:acyl carrier protein [Oscillospiraceae bacterium]
MIFERLKNSLAEQFDADPAEITRETNIITDLGADSLDLVELIMSFEEEYNISVVDEAVYEFKTVGDITDFIEAMIST